MSAPRLSDAQLAALLRGVVPGEVLPGFATGSARRRPTPASERRSPRRWPRWSTSIQRRGDVRCCWLR